MGMCVSHLDPAEHAGIEDVHAGIDLVRDEDLRLLDEAMDPPAVRLKHHHTVLRGLLHPSHLHTHTYRQQPSIVSLTSKLWFNS